MKYRDYLLGVVSDVEFPRNHALTPEAGFQLARMIRGIVPDVPIVLQSSRTEFMQRAYRRGVWLPAKALAYPAGRFAAHAGGRGGLRRLRLPPLRRQNRGRARQ